MPETLSFSEAATLPCAALTAWNALYGRQALKPGDWVLTQGTGGVSIFALQFAVAAGASVIATTSSDEKAKKLKELGAQHVINYKKDPNWGETAKNLSPGKLGIQHIIEVTFHPSLPLAATLLSSIPTNFHIPGRWPQHNDTIPPCGENRRNNHSHWFPRWCRQIQLWPLDT